VLYECAFSSAGLSGDERDFARTRACVVQMARQFFELGMAFEQVHGGASIRQAVPSEHGRPNLGVPAGQFR
jgi:hypothetical protein